MTQYVSETREKRIQQIKDCGQSIIDNAESIYGDYAFSTSLKVTIDMPVREVPQITVERSFFAEKMLEHL